MSNILPSIVILGTLAAVALFLTLSRDWGARVDKTGTGGAVRIASFTVVAQAAHFAEELFTGFPEKFPILFGLGPMSRAFFVSFNLAWIAVWSASIWGVGKKQRAALFPLWFLSLGCVANGLAHPLFSAFVGGYFPGLLTAPVVAVLGLVLLRRLVEITEPTIGTDLV